MKLNLGCGNDHKKGYLNCDISPEVHPDKIVDLTKRLPFKDNSVEEVILENVLEHLSDLIFLMEELYRISTPGARIKIIVPYFRSVHAFSDPTHVKFFTFKTFNYFSLSSKFNYYSQARFEIIKRKGNSNLGRFHNILLETFANCFSGIYEKLFSSIFPLDFLYIELKPIK